MRTRFSLLLVCGAAVIVALSPMALAQTQPPKPKGPAGKIYVAEIKGEPQIINGGKIAAARQASAFDAVGTIVETKTDSHIAFVYSNGTGLYLGQNSRIEINSFTQDAFQTGPAKTDTTVEPSMSHSLVSVARGSVSICTNQLASGSTMVYTTPVASVNVRRGRVAIATTAEESTIDLLEGDVTVRGGDKDSGGLTLQPGERVVVHAGLAGQPPSLTVSKIPSEAVALWDAAGNVACNAKKTVAFDVTETDATQGAAGATQEIVPRPTVTENLPANITVSADRLPGGDE